MPEIKDIEYVGHKVGKGSYGSVSLIRVNGVPCIRKSLHCILSGHDPKNDVNPEHTTIMKDKFYRECKILWKLQHPNVVQFMGIHYDGDGEQRRLSLIMEFMPSSLEGFISDSNAERFEVPLSIKLSVLRDVTYGLTQLHQRGIIHRDLSASNILLSSCLRAKIADFGMSKLIGMGTLTKQTVAPGAIYVMPPEALEENPNYSVQLDIFSFGVISLYLILQKFPYPTETTLTSFHLENKQLAIGKRQSFLRELGEISITMENVVFNCLQDVPKRRPTVRKLTRDLSYCLGNHQASSHKDKILVLQTKVGRKLSVRAHYLFVLITSLAMMNDTTTMISTELYVYSFMLSFY